MQLICEGKTKRIYKSDRPNVVIVETKDELTGGDAAKRETISGIATHKTKQTSDVFAYLKRRGIPTAFVERLGDKKFSCEECAMLPLELVSRRYAWGSFLKREPTLVSTVAKPHRFNDIRTEIFHKHAVVQPPLVPQAVQMEEGAARAAYLKNGVWPVEVLTDPFVRTAGEWWYLHSAKLPVDERKPALRIKAELSTSDLEFLIQKIMIPTFAAIEEAWAKIDTADGPVRLVDMKIEVGRRKSDGQIVVADVIDNDSWRIWPGGNPERQLDKQCFRDGRALGEVAEKYALVAQLTGRF